MIATVIEDLEKSARQIMICSSDGVMVKITVFDPVHYWARASDGRILVGIGPEGRRSIMAILGNIESQELELIAHSIRVLSHLMIENISVDIFSDHENINALLSYEDEEGMQLIETDDVERFYLEYMGKDFNSSESLPIIKI